jgi:hypothetical protein
LNIIFGTLEDFDASFFKDEERYVESIFQPTLRLSCVAAPMDVEAQ